MKNRSDKKHFFISSRYTGAGGLINMFSVNPYKPQKIIKDLYNEEVNKLSIQLNKDLSVSQLTDEERLILRHRIEDRIKKENWKKFIVFMIGILVFSGFVLMFLVFFDRLF